ncbi:MAG: hypothetical protein KAJ14_07330 [Candidatus Omnitrophica bacterium]|nr:hypothetical protein [Candidatus Omnitrophota bacterium]
MKNKLMMFLMILVFCLVGQKTSFSQNQHNENQKRRVISSLIFEELSSEDRKELRGIRQDDKGKFRKIMTDLMVEKKEELEILKKDDPKLYRKTIQGVQEKIKKNLGQMEKKYKGYREGKQKVGNLAKDELMAQGFMFQTLTKDKQIEILMLRQKYRKTLADAIKKRRGELKELKENNPEKYKKLITAAREKAKQLIKKGKEKYPQKFEKLGKMKLEYIEDKFKWLKEDDPELYNNVMERKRLRYREGEVKDGQDRLDSVEGEFDVNEFSNYYNE